MLTTNPFIISGYAGAETFCDRAEETTRLIHLIDNGNNIVLTAPRRIGKTDLIAHVFAQPMVSEKYTTISVDIYATKSFSDFVMFMGKAIIDALKPQGKKIMDNFLTILQSLRSEITFDIYGMPTLGIGLGKSINPDITLDEIFKYIDSSDRPCIIAIDEFQQIAKYDDGWKIEALLRSHIQRCHNAHFIFSGSQQHLMAEMFVSPARPFYMSATLMDLPLIDKDIYIEFCQQMFAFGDKRVEPQCVVEVYDTFKGVTAYMQRVMNEMYAATSPGAICTTESLAGAIKQIIDQASEAYEALYYQLTERQRTTMLAIARNGGVENYTSSDFVKKYNLVSGSSVRSSIVTLQDKDLLTSAKGKVEIYDKFFELWLVRRYEL